jgi:hypothetical protein
MTIAQMKLLLRFITGPACSTLTADRAAPRSAHSPH